MYLINTICQWLRDQRRPVHRDEIIAHFAPTPDADPAKPQHRQRALDAARHKRGHVRNTIQEAITEGRLLAGADDLIRCGRTARVAVPIMPAVYDALRAAPDQRLTEKDLLERLRQRGAELTPRRLKNNIQHHVASRRIDRFVVGDERWYSLLPENQREQRQQRWDEACERTDRQKLESAHQVWARLMQSARFEDHASARTTFQPRRFDRASAVVPRGSTASLCADAGQ